MPTSPDYILSDILGTVNISPSQALRAEVAKVRPSFSGYVKDLGGARIGVRRSLASLADDGYHLPLA